MSYRSILVNLRLGQDNSRLLAVVASLADRFGAHVAGVAVWQPIEVAYSDSVLAPELLRQDRQRRGEQAAAAEAEFRETMHGHGTSLDWHAWAAPPNLAGEVAVRARSADLIVTPVSRGQIGFEFSRPLNLGDLIMEAGRPVLIVPEATESLTLGHVLVAWKDGREARRAVAAALPALRAASHVTIAEIAPEDDLAQARRHLDDVGAWLSRHGITPELLPLAANGDDAGRLNLLAEDRAVDLIVAGAYAHSRLREWILGSVTHHLLQHSEICSLVTH